MFSACWLDRWELAKGHRLLQIDLTLGIANSCASNAELAIDVDSRHIRDGLTDNVPVLPSWIVWGFKTTSWGYLTTWNLWCLRVRLGNALEQDRAPADLIILAATAHKIISNRIFYIIFRRCYDSWVYIHLCMVCLNIFIRVSQVRIIDQILSVRVHQGGMSPIGIAFDKILTLFDNLRLVPVDCSLQS